MAYIKYSSNARLTTNYDEINIIGNGKYILVLISQDTSEELLESNTKKEINADCLMFIVAYYCLYYH